MTITEMEKEIIKALNINMKVDWISQDPIKEFKDLKKFVRELFKEYRGEKKYITETINGILKGDK